MAEKSSQAQALMATTRSTTIQSPQRQGYSPLFEGYNRWATIYGSSLPRSFDTFRSGDFSPMEPILPNPIDIPEEPSGRPRPRRWQFPVGWNLPVGQPGTEGVKLANFQVLRDLTDVGSIPRRAVEICKSDLLNLNWGIVPTDNAEKAMQGNPAKRKDFDSRRAELWNWLENEIDPGLYDDFFDWLNAALEDLIVLDALALHVLPSRGRNSGPLGSNVGGLELLDGSTIRPILNTYGGRPLPPEVAWQQFIWGVPRVDLMDIINLGPDATIEDLKELNPLINDLTETIDEWSGDQLVYMKMNSRTNNPYGFGPVEQCLLPISIMQARQTWQWEFYRSGSLPSVFLDPGPMIATPEEARELQEAINMTGGDLAARHQVLVLPPGAKATPQKDTDMADTFDSLMVAEIAMSFGLQLDDFGMMPKVAMMTSPAAAKADQQGAQDKTVRRSTIPRARKLERFFTRLIQVQFGCTDMKFSAGTTEQGESENDLDTRHINRVKASIESIDEARLALNLEPIGEDWSTVPLAFTATGVTPLGTAVETANVNLDNLKNPAPIPPALATHAGAAAAGGSDGPDDKPTPSGTDVPAMGDDDKPSSAAHAGAQAAEATDRAAAKRGPLKVKPKTAHPKAVARDATLAPLRDKVASEITRMALAVQAKTMTTAEFTRQSGELMTSATVEAAHHGATAAASDFSTSVPDTTTAVATERAASQHPYLVGLALGALGGSSMTIANRASIYAQSLTGSFEQAYGATAIASMSTPSAATDGLLDGSGMSAGPSDAVITWHAEPDACDNCADRDANTYTTATLPGWPGDGSFGGDLCLGGPNCRCTLTYEDGTNTDTGMNTLRDQSLAGSLSADMGPMGHVNQWLAGRQAFTDALPDVVQPNEVYSAQARAVMRDQVRQQLSRELGVHPADVPASAVAQRVPAIYKSLSGDTKTVYKLLTKHYPDKSIEWIGQMKWGKREVPIEKISVTGPASDKDAKTIRRMSKKMKKGKKIKPLVLIDPGDKGLLQVADGHHRATAALHANKQSVPAYVGRPQTDDDWRKEVMEMQIVRAKKMSRTKDFSVSSGFVPFDLSGPEIDVKFAGLLLMAADSGRVLMLQRSLAEDDEAAGTWELPGGNLEEGESPLEGAVREWTEEVGTSLPIVEVVGRWVSANGYMGFLCVCASESDVALRGRDVVNPDDPDQDNPEAIAWFYPSDLASMPGVRREARDMTPWTRIASASAK